MPNYGLVELAISIKQVPPDVTTDKNGWTCFAIDCDGRSFSVKLRPRMWQKLQAAEKEIPDFTAKITGKMGAAIPGGHELSQPTVQIFQPKKEASDPG